MFIIDTWMLTDACIYVRMHVLLILLTGRISVVTSGILLWFLYYAIFMENVLIPSTRHAIAGEMKPETARL